jgi:hypothetical protein
MAHRTLDHDVAATSIAGVLAIQTSSVNLDLIRSKSWSRR